MIEWLSGLDWETVLGALGTAIAAVVAAYRVRDAIPNRTRIKTDLEIMEKMGTDHPHYDKVKSHVDLMILDTYSDLRLPREKRQQLRIMQIVYGIIGAGLMLWTYSLIQDGWTWWAILTGFFAFSFLINLVLLPQIIKRREIHQEAAARAAASEKDGTPARFPPVT